MTQNSAKSSIFSLLWNQEMDVIYVLLIIYTAVRTVFENLVKWRERWQYEKPPFCCWHRWLWNNRCDGSFLIDPASPTPRLIYLLLFFNPQLTGTVGAQSRLPQNVPRDISIILNESGLRNSQCKRDTLTLLSVSLKWGNKSLMWKGHSLHLEVEGHSYCQR